MNKNSSVVALLLSLAVLLCACGSNAQQPTSTSIVKPSTTLSTTQTPTSPTIPEIPHSPLYIEGLSVEDVIRYFNEVTLDAEFVNSGNARLIQKWISPIQYQIMGEPTEQDMEVLNHFTAWLNSIEGFPGISPAKSPLTANLRIHFCSQKEMVSLMGDRFTNTDGAVTFWYTDDIIYDAIICYRTDVSQFVRNSVILEEIYNGLGPIQDTNLRPDSIIYSGFSTPQNLTDVDELILKLLYHPQIQCGMDAAQCEAVIRQLYY